MNWTLEVVPVPVTDMDRAKSFYADQVGFGVDLDDEVSPGVRIIQMTPPGSRCSVAMLQGMPEAPKGVKLDSEARIRTLAPQIHQQAVLGKAMPPGNLTGMTEEERMLLDRWFRSER